MKNDYESIIEYLAPKIKKRFLDVGLRVKIEIEKIPKINPVEIDIMASVDNAKMSVVSIRLDNIRFDNICEYYINDDCYAIDLTSDDNVNSAITESVNFQRTMYDTIRVASAVAVIARSMLEKINITNCAVYSMLTGSIAVIFADKKGIPAHCIDGLWKFRNSSLLQGISTEELSKIMHMAADSIAIEYTIEDWSI